MKKRLNLSYLCKIFLSYIFTFSSSNLIEKVRNDLHPQFPLLGSSSFFSIQKYFSVSLNNKMTIEKRKKRTEKNKLNIQKFSSFMSRTEQFRKSEKIFQ
jgi:hypothetical protein